MPPAPRNPYQPARARALAAGALAIVAGAALGGCASAPEPHPDPEGAIATAEQQLQAGDAAAAVAILQALATETLPFRLAERHQLALGAALYNSGQVWNAFQIIERFPEKFPHSDRRAAVAELEYRIGKTLLESGRSFLFFYSERRGGRAALEHLLTRHPDSARVPDALRLLGDMSFEDEDYVLAQERYRDLMRRYPDSEWVVYARFRYAMSIVAGLQGPEYDLDQMQHASRELADFLAAQPENPDFVAQAGEALERLREWRAERHLVIAAFYLRVDNPKGHRLHLEYAANTEFAGTTAHARAVAALAELGAGATKPASPTPGAGQ
ncbi:MAG: outer membrane protein assembly factor BamD [bacterium]|nr:outer membrane protein assembly factor BamD [bacterium]